VESGEASVAGAAIAVAAHRASSELVIAAAKIRAGEAAAIAHQVHGAFGFTHKHRLLRLTRRSWSWRDEFGTESRWSRELGRREVHVQGEPPKVIRCSDLVNCHRNPPTFMVCSTANELAEIAKFSVTSVKLVEIRD